MQRTAFFKLDNGQIGVKQSNRPELSLYDNKLRDEIVIWKAENGIVITHRGKIHICNPQDDVQKTACRLLGVDINADNVVLSERIHVRLQQETCPHCGSNSTTKHGIRKTQREWQQRNLCNDCNHSFVSEREEIKQPATAPAVTVFTYKSQEGEMKQVQVTA